MSSNSPGWISSACTRRGAATRAPTSPRRTKRRPPSLMLDRRPERAQRADRLRPEVDVGGREDLRRLGQRDPVRGGRIGQPSSRPDEPPDFDPPDFELPEPFDPPVDASALDVDDSDDEPPPDDRESDEPESDEPGRMSRSLTSRRRIDLRSSSTRRRTPPTSRRPPRLRRAGSPAILLRPAEPLKWIAAARTPCASSLGAARRADVGPGSLIPWRTSARDRRRCRRSRRWASVRRLEVSRAGGACRTSGNRTRARGPTRSRSGRRPGRRARRPGPGARPRSGRWRTGWRGCWSGAGQDLGADPVRVAANALPPQPTTPGTIMSPVASSQWDATPPTTALYSG